MKSRNIKILLGWRVFGVFGIFGGWLSHRHRNGAERFLAIGSFWGFWGIWVNMVVSFEMVVHCNQYMAKMYFLWN